MGLFSDEAGRFIGGYAMSDEHMLKTAAGLSEIWDGSEITRTRGADNQTFVLHDRRLAMHLMLQPIVAYRIIANPLLMGQGFLPRCLVVHPESRIGSRPYVEANTRKHPAVIAMSERFTDLVQKGMTLKTKEKSQRNVTLDPDAKAYWVELYNEFETRSGKEYESIQAMSCKAADQTARLATVLAYANNSDLKSIPLDAVERAASLMDFYLKESLRLQEISEEDQRIKLAEKLMDWAFKESDPSVVVRDSENENHVEINLRGLLQRGPNRLRTKAKAERILKFLHEHGIARKLPKAKFGESETREAWEIQRCESD